MQFKDIKFHNSLIRHFLTLVPDLSRDQQIMCIIYFRQIPNGDEQRRPPPRPTRPPPRPASMDVSSSVASGSGNSQGAGNPPALPKRTSMPVIPPIPPPPARNSGGNSSRRESQNSTPSRENSRNANTSTGT